MNNQHFFADVDLPFHVWVREGGRWVLREAPQARGAESAGNPPARAQPASRKRSERRAR